MPPETVAHQSVQELLPWYVNGTLVPEERHRIEMHLTTCAVCRQEVALLEQISTALHADVPEPKVDLYPRTLARLQSAHPAGLLDRIRNLVAPIPRYAQVALAAQLAVVALLVVALVSQGPFATLSDGGPTGPAVRVQVAFQDQTTLDQVQGILTPLKARIIDGPSATGLYVLEVPLGPSGLASSPEDVLRQVRRSRLVTFAEILEETR